MFFLTSNSLIRPGLFLDGPSPPRDERNPHNPASIPAPVQNIESIRFPKTISQKKHPFSRTKRQKEPI